MAISADIGHLGLDDPALYLNRELSWLDFNARVLAMAGRGEVPLLERCKFLAIFSNNLDEFFMVRVAGQQEALESSRASSSPDQLPREEVLNRIASATRLLVSEQYRIWNGLQPELSEAGVQILRPDDLDSAAVSALSQRFEREIEPVLTPLAVGPGLPFPFISQRSLNLGLTVRDPASGESRLARVKVPPGKRFLAVADGFVLLEDLIEANIERIFAGMEIDATIRFRMTRDADLDISDEADDLLGAVEAQIRRRRFGDVVRLEVEEGAPATLLAEIQSALDIEDRDIYHMSGPLDLTALFELTRLERPALLDRPWRARTQWRLQSAPQRPIDLFDVIRRGDVLVHHPYEDFATSVEAFVEQAAEDPDVVAIKQTLYRTGRDTPIVPALVRAAEAGKQVVCLMELQARFDEERNIHWARALERAGVHVAYGLLGMKTHAKLALVMRREGDRVRRYAHIGTGNYHPDTARLYTDLGLFTCNDEITQDVADLFNYLTGFSRSPEYRQVLVAPLNVRDGLIREIRTVVARHEAGEPGRIEMKVNSIMDGPVIRELYQASQAGVAVDLVVRGICGLIPGIPGYSDNIRVRSIIGRFLEHSRVFLFTNGEHTRYLMGSPDIMERNLDHRVETVIPIHDAAAQKEIRFAFDVAYADTVLAWALGADGAWTPVRNVDGEAPVDSQAALMERAVRRSERRGGRRGQAA